MEEIYFGNTVPLSDSYLNEAFRFQFVDAPPLHESSGLPQPIEYSEDSPDLSALEMVGVTQADAGGEGLNDNPSGDALGTNAGGYKDNGRVDDEFGSNYNAASVNSLGNGGLLSQDQLTGADAANEVAAKAAAAKAADEGKESELWKMLNSKAGIAMAGQLVGGLLGGVGSGAAAKTKQKSDRELLDAKYQQQLDYMKRTGTPGKVKAENWTPVLKNGLLGQAAK